LKERLKKFQEYPLAFTLSEKGVCLISTATKPQLTLVEALAEETINKTKSIKRSRRK